MVNHNRFRRVFLQAAGLLGAGMVASRVQAHHTDTHFEDAARHKLVYQLNKADNGYISSILFSVGEMLRKHGDDVELVVTVIGPGLNLLGKRPVRPIDSINVERARSLAAYGVSFHACGNTMKSLHWEEEDIADFATIVKIGAEDLMLLQEKGFSYISW